MIIIIANNNNVNNNNNDNNNNNKDDFLCSKTLMASLKKIILYPSLSLSLFLLSSTRTPTHLPHIYIFKSQYKKAHKQTNKITTFFYFSLLCVKRSGKQMI